MSDLSELLLRVTEDPDYQTKGSTLTFEELDANFILLANVLKQALLDVNPGGVDAYDGATEYVDGDLVTYGGNLWMYTYPTASTGNVPAADSDYWTLQSTGILSHAQNTDTHTTQNAYGIGDNTDTTDKELYARIGAAPASAPRLRYNSTDNKWEFTNDGSTFQDFGSGTISPWSDTAAGVVEKAVQAEAETAAEVLPINRDNDKGLTALMFRYAYDAVFAWYNRYIDLGNKSGSAVSIDLSQGRNFKITQTGNIANLTFTNAVQGMTYYLLVERATDYTFTLKAADWAGSGKRQIELTSPAANNTSPNKSLDLISIYCYAPGVLVFGLTPDIQPL
jgi:hypothetical protein